MKLNKIKTRYTCIINPVFTLSPNRIRKCLRLLKRGGCSIEIKGIVVQTWDKWNIICLCFVATLWKMIVYKVFFSQTLHPPSIPIVRLAQWKKHWSLIHVNGARFRFPTSARLHVWGHTIMQDVLWMLHFSPRNKTAINFCNVPTTIQCIPDLSCHSLYNGRCKINQVSSWNFIAYSMLRHLYQA